MLDVIKRRIKSDKEIAILSFICGIGIVINLISLICYFIYGDIDFVVTTGFLLRLISIVVSWVYVSLYYKTDNARKIYMGSVVLECASVVLRCLNGYYFLGKKAIILVTVSLVLSAAVLFLIYKKTDKKSHIIILSILYTVSLVFTHSFFINRTLIMPSSLIIAFIIFYLGFKKV